MCRVDEATIAPLRCPRSPDQGSATVPALVEVAADAHHADVARADLARRQLADCDAKLDRYRKPLDSGADPVVIGQWIAEVRAERAAAEARMVAASPDRLGVEDIEAMVAWLTESWDRFARVLDGSPERRQELYDSLRLEVRYEPGADHVWVGLVPGGNVRVGGGT